MLGADYEALWRRKRQFNRMDAFGATAVTKLWAGECQIRSLARQFAGRECRQSRLQRILGTEATPSDRIIFCAREWRTFKSNLDQRMNARGLQNGIAQMYISEDLEDVVFGVFEVQGAMRPVLICRCLYDLYVPGL